MGIMIIVWVICHVFQLVNHLVFQEMILSYHFIRLIIVPIVYSVVLCHHYKKTMELLMYCSDFYQSLIWCIVFDQFVVYSW